ncbi:MAG TPA: GNAT family N-acetyltransferase [Streptosporangiaceae bacterium]
MPAVFAEDVIRSAADRWRRIDPLLPDPAPSASSQCGAKLAVPAADGQAAALGWCSHRKVGPGAAELAWGAASQFWLTGLVAGDPGEPGIGAGVDELLVRWRAHLMTEPASAGEDSQAAVRWPSRDAAGVRALLRHGLQPLTVIAARPTGRAVPDADPAPAGVRIRPAGPADAGAFTELTLEVIRFDQQFGSVLLRPDAERAERRAARRTLALPQPWTWLAERDGQAVGLLVAEPPDRARWIAAVTSQSPVAYLGTLSVLPDERGSGVGTALVARLHRELDAAGVAVTLLHHGLLNPLSAPFWNRMGYRPLWTSWEIRPASALR